MEADPAMRTASANYNFLTSAVMPRPIAWVTTLDPATGVVNAAPFSWFNSVCADPPMLALAINRKDDGGLKDTMRNIRASNQFVVNVAPKALLREMVQTSGDYGTDVSELEVVGLQTTPSRKVQPPRIAASPVNFECRLVQDIPLGKEQQVSLVLGEVVHLAADDAVLDARGNVDPDRLVLVARMGGHAYTDSGAHYAVRRPTSLDVGRKGG